MRKLPDQELAVIREEIFLDDSLSRARPLFSEIDRLRRLELLTREWVRVRYTSVESDVVYRIKNAIQAADL